MKLNKAEKFVKRQFDSGKTYNQVREAIFDKLGTWNFPPEYNQALKTFDRVDYEFYNGPLVHSEDAELAIAKSQIHDIDAEECCQEADLHSMRMDLIADITKSLPEPGTREWEAAVDKMRSEVEFMDSYGGIIKAAQKSMESRGLNFWEEFAKWQRNILRCNNCKHTWMRTKHSTGYCEECGSSDVTVAARLAERR